MHDCRCCLGVPELRVYPSPPAATSVRNWIDSVPSGCSGEALWSRPAVCPRACRASSSNLQRAFGVDERCRPLHCGAHCARFTFAFRATSSTSWITTPASLSSMRFEATSNSTQQLCIPSGTRHTSTASAYVADLAFKPQTSAH
jgi:hypothetical protein